LIGNNWREGQDDHFHVKKYLNDAVDMVKKEELKRARQQNNGELSQLPQFMLVFGND
jgi:hypothetical protein